MKTITAPNGKQYEVEDGWEPMETMPYGVAVNLLSSSGIINAQISARQSDVLSTCIAWRPIVPPKEKRWRAYHRGVYWIVDKEGDAMWRLDMHELVDDKCYSIGNYFRTREEAEASNKAKVMRDPESER